MIRKQLYLPVLFVMVLLSFTPPKQIHVWMIGDSTMAGKKADRAPESGWGEAMQSYLKSNVIVHNHAASGRSTLSFINEKRWQAVVDSIHPGDYLIVQFGHNDEKPKATIHTEPFGSFQDNIRMFIEKSREKGASPIVCSSIVRRHFDGKGNLLQTHGDYIAAARDIAEKTSTPYVDMEALTRELVLKLGPEGSKSLFTFCEPGECPLRMAGVQDSTHLNFYGSAKIAYLFVKDAKLQQLEIATFMK